MKLLTKSLCIAMSTFKKKYFIAILLCLVFLTYLPYATKISWGDYSGYILQAEAMFISKRLSISFYKYALQGL